MTGKRASINAHLLTVGCAKTECAGLRRLTGGGERRASGTHALQVHMYVIWRTRTLSGAHGSLQGAT